MTPSEIVAAHKAVVELSKTVLPFPVARKLAKLKKRLDDELSTVCDAEKALAEKHSGKVGRTGICDFSTEEDRAAFYEEEQEYLSQDDDTIRLPKVDLSKYTSIIRLSAASVEALDGIVDFGGDADG